MSATESSSSDSILPFEKKAASRHAPWHVDIYPLPCHIKSELDAIPASWFACGEDRILAGGGGVSPGGEPEAVAAFLQGVVEEAADQAGHWPRVIEVRHERVARLLQPRLAEHGVEVRAGTDFAGSDAAARRTILEMTGLPDLWPPQSTPMTWTAWGQPPERIAALFHAAASYARAAPWKNFQWAAVTSASLPDAGQWTAVATGGLGTIPGLQLYANADDLLTVTAPGRAAEGDLPPIASDTIMTLELHTAEELPPPMRREIALAGWEVADTDAYPVLQASASPGAGISAQDFADLTAVLLAFARRTEVLEETFPSESWVDPESGIVLEPRGFLPDSQAEAQSWDDDAPVLPGGAQGPGADLAARTRGHSPYQLLEDVVEIAIEFTNWLQWREGESAMDESVRTLEDAVRFLRSLAWRQVPVAAVHEFDLREFLTVYPTERDAAESDEEVARVIDSLSALFEFLASEKEIECPWAHPIFDDRHTYKKMSTAIRMGMKGEEVVNREALETILLVSLTYSQQRGFTSGLELGAGLEWSEEPGPNEDLLHNSLDAIWLLWREEIIAEGVTSARELVERLAARREAWAQAPHPEFGRSPIEVVESERARG